MNLSSAKNFVQNALPHLFYNENDETRANIEGAVQVCGNDGYPVNFVPRNAAVVTPSDSETFDEGILFIGVGGDVKAMPAGQEAFVTFKNIPDGSSLPVSVIAVHTDTTATDMLILT